MYNKGGAEINYWEPAFELIRDINILEESIPMIKDGVLSKEQKTSLIGEVAFLRAYVYFALAFSCVYAIIRRNDFLIKGSIS